MLLPFDAYIKGILWTVLFGMAKAFQYSGLAILGVEGWKRLKSKFVRNSGLHSYVENSILPRYNSFDEGHNVNHVSAVIDQAMMLSRYYDVDMDMIYVAAAYHDIGIEYGRDNHHVHSSRIVREDSNLKKWFSEEQIQIIADATEDHRASSSREPRTIYGRIIAEADRQIIPDLVIKRAIQFGLKNYPLLSREEQWTRVKSHLIEKYSVGGYLKLWIPESSNAKALFELREILSNEKQLRSYFDTIYDEIVV